MKNDIIHTLEKKGDVRVEDIEMDDSLKGLLITFGAYFDVDEKFCLDTKDNPEEWVNLYGLYSNFLSAYLLRIMHEALTISYFFKSDDDNMEKVCRA